MTLFFFYSFALLAVLGGLGVILLAKPTRALLSLLLCMASLAGIFLLHHAYFLAMIHLIVYAGAVLVLFLFVIMIQGLGAVEIPFTKNFPATYRALIIAMVLACAAVLVSAFLMMPASPITRFVGTAKVIGKELFTTYLLPFELTSILLLLGVFAAVSLAKRED